MKGLRFDYHLSVVSCGVYMSFSFLNICSWWMWQEYEMEDKKRNSDGKTKTSW